jgi:hypothetical protein
MIVFAVLLQEILSVYCLPVPEVELTGRLLES